jgi:hypothetical protein
MTNARRLIAVVIGTTLALPLAATGAELSKRGSYSGVFGWHFVGEAEGAQGNVIWGGVATGTFRNDAGSGFLHAALVKCSSAGTVSKEWAPRDGGECVATDSDGDKAFASWKCTDCPTKGEFHWLGGTGKYAGIKGRNTYLQTNAAVPMGAPAGWSVWKGEWQLP